MVRAAAFGLVVICTMGCTSFRTTALYRFENDSVAPERTKPKLKGIPVKLKVPSHVAVTIYEQQVLLAEDAEAVKAVKDAAKAALTALAAANTDLKNKQSEIEDLKDQLTSASTLLTKAKQTVDDPSAKPADKLVAKQQIAKYGPIVEQLENTDIPKAIAEIPDLEGKVRKASVANAVARDRAKTPTNALISFDPKQLMVDTELKYTDKVFLVDFRRPAGGILDLKEASMDDEQYFSKVQAEVTERTISDISGAITTLKDPVKSLVSPTKNSAKATSAITPDGEVADGTDFQKSVIAFQQFDISEPGWEFALQDFINCHLMGATATMLQQPPLAPPAPQN